MKTLYCVEGTGGREEMSEQAPDGGAVRLRACSALPSCTSWSR